MRDTSSRHADILQETESRLPPHPMASTNMPDIRPHMFEMFDLFKEDFPNRLDQLPDLKDGCVDNIHDDDFDAFLDNDTHMTQTDILQDAADRVSRKPDTRATANMIHGLRRAHAVSASVPVARITLHEDVEAKTLFDSGASYSLASAQMFRRLQTSVSDLTLSPPDAGTPSFELADGSISRPMGSARIPLMLNNTSTPTYHNMWIMRELSFDVILGCDFFARHGVILDYADSVIRFKPGKDMDDIAFHITGACMTFRGS